LRALGPVGDVVAPDAADAGAIVIDHRQHLTAGPQALGIGIAQRGIGRDRLALRRAGLDQVAGRSPVPISSATNGVAGRAMISSGGAYCSSLPLSITAMREPRWIASSMSCVTRTMVVPKRFWMASRSDCALARMIGSSAPNGSSISSSFGSAASARATPTRCCWPPDSSLGMRSRNSAGGSWNSSSNSSTRAAILPLSQPSSVGTVAMFWPTVRCGNSPCPWMA